MAIDQMKHGTFCCGMVRGVLVVFCAGVNVVVLSVTLGYGISVLRNGS